VIRRKPQGSVMVAVFWIAAVVLVAVAGGLLLIPSRHADHEADGQTTRVTQGTDDDKATQAAAPEEEDALRRPDRREAVGSEAGRVEVKNGFTVLQLAPDVQEHSGLQIEELKAVNFAPEIQAFARVVDLQPLLSDRARFTASQSQADVARATLAAAKAEYDRLASLHKEEGDIATKRIQQAEAEWKRNQAELRRFEADTAAVRDEIRQQWGDVLTGWALDGNAAEFDRLLRHQDTLLLVTMPPGQSLPPGTETVQVALGGERANALPASYVSPAPGTDPTVQGETYYFRTEARGLRAGMRADVWVPQAKNGGAGVIVPQSAVVWALGQAWAYVKLDAAHFVRRPIPTAVEAPGGWFVSDTVKPGDFIVTSGAQMLYAEEFRWQIRDEDEN
jgi:hypothetical protein